MAHFGTLSQQRLSTCDIKLRIICEEVIRMYDFTVLCGTRDEETQNKLFTEGKSKLRYPESKHNKTPSQAIDIAPWKNGVDWNDTPSFTLLAGLMFGIAHSKGIELRWGGDWNRNWDLTDQTFFDLPHFELT